MAKKKPPMKEVVDKVEMLTRVNNTLIEMIEDLGSWFKLYIEYNKHTDDFKGWMDEKRKIREKIMGGKNG